MSKETPVTPPKFPSTLINEPMQMCPGSHNTVADLGPLAGLIGTWTNKNLGTATTGGTASPYSYNIMPLPSASAPEKYILKNFKYYEEITFSPINGSAPNRGGDYTQTANVIFYEQRIYFADGPGKDQLVHAENGSWLFLVTGKQLKTPYKLGSVCPTKPDPVDPNNYEKEPVTGIPAQSVLTNVAKQISVPHGNSILVQGGVDGYIDGTSANAGAYVQKGPVAIPNYLGKVLPNGVDTTPYDTEGDGNPYPALNKNPNEPLQNGATASPCAQYIHWAVDTKNEEAKGFVTNIPFEMQKANVVDYNADYWLQALTAGGEYTQLAYTQTILMKIPINGKLVEFPHITCNTLTKKS